MNNSLMSVTRLVFHVEMGGICQRLQSHQRFTQARSISFVSPQLRFKSKDEAYKVFFLVSAAIHAASAFLYLVVHQKQKEAREATEREKERRKGGGRMEYTKQLAATRVENYRRQAGGSAKEPLLGSE